MISPAGMRLLADRGIDPGRSFQALLAECRIMPPPALLQNIAAAPVLTEREIDRKAWPPTAWSRP